MKITVCDGCGVMTSALEPVSEEVGWCAVDVDIVTHDHKKSVSYRTHYCPDCYTRMWAPQAQRYLDDINMNRPQSPVDSLKCIVGNLRDLKAMEIVEKFTE